MAKPPTQFASVAQQELDLQTHGELPLPTPKRNARTTLARQHLPWETNYAAFSKDFAHAAVDRLSPNRRKTIYDPFVGNGTTLEAAASLGINSYGVELNPYSALLSRCRVATDANHRDVSSILATAARTKRKYPPFTSELLESRSISISDALLREVCSRVGCAREQLIAQLCAKPELDSETVAVVVALHTSKRRANVHRRSNPAWFMQGQAPGAPTPGVRDEWLVEAKDLARTVFEDLGSRQNPGAQARTTIFAGSFEMAPIRRRTIGRFLTSPPYLNRLDYVNPTLPELQLMNMAEPADIEALRTSMMGTTKMRARKPLDSSFPSATAMDLISTVAKHPTKASGTYYLKFFEQYLGDLQSFLLWLSERATSDCEGLVVIQDSFYKEIRVPITEIISELSGAVGFRVAPLRKDVRSRHMGSISPHQRSHAPTKELTEYTLLFER